MAVSCISEEAIGTETTPDHNNFQAIMCTGQKSQQAQCSLYINVNKILDKRQNKHISK